MDKPLTITAELIGNASLAPYTPDIAALLEYQWLVSHGLLQPEPSPDSVITPDLPIAKYWIDDYWQWHCSSPIYSQQSSDHVLHTTKRWDMGLEHPVDWGRKKQRIQTDGGPYKSWRKPVFINNVSAVHWYAVGDADEVRSLLEPVTNLGARRGAGFGQVFRWTVIETGCDRVPIHNGTLTTPIPTRFVERLGITLNGNPLRKWSVHAPRQHPATQELFAMPNFTHSN